MSTTTRTPGQAKDALDRAVEELRWANEEAASAKSRHEQAAEAVADAQRRLERAERDLQEAAGRPVEVDPGRTREAIGKLMGSRR